MEAAVASVHVVVPAGIDDPARPSGGNAYDRRLLDELTDAGWTVHRHGAAGRWPDPAPADVDTLNAQLDALSAGSTVLVDGLVASAAPTLIGGYADRLRIVVLVHLPLGVSSTEHRPNEAAMLARVAAVVATSAWTRSWLVDQYGLDAETIRIAVPGSDPAGLAPGTPSGGALLCVGAVTPTKGQDVLLDALSEISELSWSCTCVGSLDVDAAFATMLRGHAGTVGLDDRVAFTGPLHGARLHAAYGSADVLVLPSRAETYGMVVTEALARGLPVIGSRTGGVPEALGTSPDGHTPGLLVPAGDAPALAAALRAWLDDDRLRDEARRAARDRRLTLPTWPDTAARVAGVLAPGVRS
jgi:glycosyltransferase involved in cell wall biosynthesis